MVDKEPSECYRFLSSVHAFIKTQRDEYGQDQKDVEPTGFLYSGFRGGVIHVPEEHYERFLDLYAKDISNGRNHYISEQRSIVYRMHMDNDFLVEDEFKHEEIFMLGAFYIKHTKRFYRELIDKMTPAEVEKTFTLIILTRPSDTKTLSNGKEGFKTGLHLIFPNLVVNSNQALTLRETYIMELKREFGPRNPENSWETVVDHLIYTKNGLRMTYSKKINNCPACKGSKRKTCDECMDSGKIVDNRAYKPYMVIGGFGKENLHERDYLQKNIFHAIKQTSIRVSTAICITQCFSPYEGAPTVDKSLLNNRGRRTVVRCTSDSQRSNGCMEKAQKDIHIDREDPRFSELVDFIRTQTNPHWSEIDGKTLTSNLKGTWYRLIVSGMGSSWCQNKNKDHRSSKIYFTINERGVHQKCFCRKLDLHDRRCGYCSQYTSYPWVLSKAMMGLFFKNHASDWLFSELLLCRSGLNNQKDGNQISHIMNVLGKKNTQHASETTKRMAVPGYHLYNTNQKEEIEKESL